MKWIDRRSEVIGVVKGEGASPPKNWNTINDKSDDNKAYCFCSISVSFNIFANNSNKQ